MRTVQNGALKEILYAQVNGAGVQQFAPPAGEVWKPLSLFAQFVTAAVIGTRTFQMEFVESAANTVFLQVLAGAGQVISLTRFYNAFNGAPELAAFLTDQIMMPMPPDIYLSGTNSDRLLVGDYAGVSALDQTNAVLQYERSYDA